MTPTLQDRARLALEALPEEGFGMKFEEWAENHFQAVEEALRLAADPDMVYVPREPDGKMWSKGRYQFGVEECRCRTARTDEFYQTVKDTAPTEIYKAMIAAAPVATTESKP